MLKSNYTEEEVAKVEFPCIAYKFSDSYVPVYKIIILFHNITSGIVLYSTKESEIGRYSDRLNFLDFQEFKGSVTITNK